MMPDVGFEVSRARSARTAISLFSRKLSTVRRVFHDRGPRGIAAVLKRKGASLAHTFGMPNLRTVFQVWCEREHWWVGMLVVCAGNVVRVDSCTFQVSHRAIRTASKSLFVLGGYERAEREILKAYLSRSLPVVELGGSIGVVACVTNRLLQDPRKHVVVEANPDLIGVMVANRERNGCMFSVVNRALAYDADSTTFYVDGHDFLASSVQVKTERPIEVPVVSLERILEENGFRTCSLVCDIEGGEMELVRRERKVLQQRVAMIIVEIHGWRVGWEQGAEMIRTLEDTGFRCLHEKDGTYVFRNERLRVDIEAAVAC
jgi:FkbM family methyltransferase